MVGFNGSTIHDLTVQLHEVRFSFAIRGLRLFFARQCRAFRQGYPVVKVRFPNYSFFL
jgi:hypothetical protein